MTFIKPIELLLISMAIVLGLGCQKEPSPKKNSLSFFKVFKFEKANNPQLSSDITINLAEVDVKPTQANVEYIGMDSFVPTFSALTGAKVYVNNVEQQSGVTSQDFLNTVEYKVVSESGDTQTYKITINYMSTDFSITPEGVISGKNTDITTAVIGEYMNGVRVTAIAKGGFISYTSLTKLRLPNSLKSIGDVAFNECSGFSGNLIIPSSVTSIGDGAFNECSGFTGTLTLPDSLKSIGDATFNRCSGFSGNLIIPSSVTSIGEIAFSKCSGFDGTLTLSSSLKSIEKGAFWNCSGFTGNLTIPSSVITIETVAFAGCSGFTNLCNQSSATPDVYAFHKVTTNTSGCP